MKIVDKTPFQTEKGESSSLDRLQGMLKYGPSWYPELTAQKNIITQLDRALEKGFVLIRNLTLPGSEIVEPIILIGQGGIYVIYITHLRGYYQAKGDQWNIDSGGRFKPAQPNLMSIVSRLAKALGRYLQIHGIELPIQVDPVLIAADPGLHVDSMRPAVRVVQSDAVKQFAASLLQSRPILTIEQVYDLADRIVTPRPKSEPPLQVAAPPAAPKAAPDPIADNPAARAHAIFNASEQAQPLNPSDVSFALQDESAGELQELRDSTTAVQSLPKPTAKKRGISTAQWAVLGFIVIVEFCILAGFGYLIFFNK